MNSCNINLECFKVFSLVTQRKIGQSTSIALTAKSRSEKLRHMKFNINFSFAVSEKTAFSVSFLF